LRARLQLRERLSRYFRKAGQPLPVGDGRADAQDGEVEE